MTNHADVLDGADVLRKLEALVEHWQHTAERFRAQWQESEWYLGETRATLVQAQEQLAAMRETYRWLEGAYGELMPQLQEAARQRDEAKRDLADARTAHEVLLREHLEMTAELEAVRRRAERRSATRTHHPDLIVEVHAADGQLLFQGCPSNVSLTGLALALDEPIADSHDFVKVTIYGPALARPIEAIGRLVWRQPAEASCHGGCELIEMSSEGRKTLEEALATAA